MSARRVLGRPAETAQDALTALHHAKAYLLRPKAVTALPAGLGGMPAPDIELVGADLLRARGPIVYAWVRGPAVLYVGMSAIGISRPLHARHHRLHALEGGDRLLIWACDSTRDAELTEGRLITTARPPLNRKIAEPIPLGALIAMIETASEETVR